MDKGTEGIVAEEYAADFARHLKGTRQLNIQRVFLYGSHAKHTANKWSDIDVCIVSRDLRGADPISVLWNSRRRKDVERLIAPVGFEPEDFDSATPSPLVWEIRKKGKEIYL